MFLLQLCRGQTFGSSWSDEPVKGDPDFTAPQCYYAKQAEVFNVALEAVATIPSSHKDLLSVVKTWQPVIYSTVPIIAAIEPQLNTSSMTNELKEALSVLYEIDGQHEKAFTLYIDLMSRISLSLSRSITCTMPFLRRWPP